MKNIKSIDIRIVGIVVCCLVVAGAAIITLCLPDALEPMPTATEMPSHPTLEATKPWTDYDLVAHAGGGLTLDDGSRVFYSNAKEAVNQNYAKGYRVFEIDFNLSNDGKLIAAHEPRDIKRLTGISGVPTHTAWLGAKILSKYTTMDAVAVLSLLLAYSDAYIVTDTKYIDTARITTQFEELVNTANQIDPTLLERIVPQIYNPAMLTTLNKIYSFKEVIYTLYMSPQTSEQVFDFVTENPQITAVTMCDSRAISDTLVGKLLTKNVKTYAHTVNTQERFNELKNVGVHGIYTDGL